MKNQKGITLVALVITIVVLLILAGVTISMVMGDNGVLKNSQKAKFESAVTDWVCFYIVSSTIFIICNFCYWCLIKWI